MAGFCSQAESRRDDRDSSGLACAEAFAQHFHTGFKVVQGAGAHPGVPVADEIVGVADQLQQLTAVMFAEFGGGQLQVEQAELRDRKSVV